MGCELKRLPERVVCDAHAVSRFEYDMYERSKSGGCRHFCTPTRRTNQPSQNRGVARGKTNSREKKRQARPLLTFSSMCLNSLERYRKDGEVVLLMWMWGGCTEPYWLWFYVAGVLINPSENLKEGNRIRQVFPKTRQPAAFLFHTWRRLYQAFSVATHTLISGKIVC
jgi:hypothetical protein